MSGSSFGTLFRVTTFGESHGAALGVIIDGCPSGLSFDETFIQKEMNRRRVGQSKITSTRGEGDEIEVFSGVFEGKTTGCPIAMMVRNKDADSSKYDALRHLHRPGHADIGFAEKFGIRDHRGGGRSSGRETLCRVAAGAVAKLLLQEFGIEIYGWVDAVGTIQGKQVQRDFIEKNIVRAGDPESAFAMEEAILEARKEGDSLGGMIKVRAENMPAGLGEPVFDKLDADIAKGMFSIGTVKGVEIGSGFEAGRLKGSENNDMADPETGKYRSNHAGGILGGISNGQPVEVTLAVKPTPSIFKKQQAFTNEGKIEDILIEGRHDPCVCPRVVPVAEAMLALVLADHLLRQRASRMIF